MDSRSGHAAHGSLAHGSLRSPFGLRGIRFAHPSRSFPVRVSRRSLRSRLVLPSRFTRSRRLLTGTAGRLRRPDIAARSAALCPFAWYAGPRPRTSRSFIPLAVSPASLTVVRLADSARHCMTDGGGRYVHCMSGPATTSPQTTGTLRGSASPTSGHRTEPISPRRPTLEPVEAGTVSPGKYNTYNIFGFQKSGHVRKGGEDRAGARPL